MQTKQIKNLEAQACELKFDDSQGYKFSGYASVFNGVDSYGDTIIKGAYKSTLENRERPIQLRWNHHGPVIGKWTRIEEDEKGLYVEGELTPDHTQAKDTYALLKHGAISGLSIGYRVKDSYMDREKGVRELREIELVEISVVETPADNQAHIEDIKTFIQTAETRKEFEDFFRNVCGLSKGDAKALVSRIRSTDSRNDEAEKPVDMTAYIQTLKF